MKRFEIVLSLSLAILICSALAEGGETISLAGEWAFRLDPDGVGMKERWFAEQLSGQARLPGSLDEQGLGFKTTETHLSRLTREYAYEGPAWFQETVVIPADWKSKSIRFFLERCHWETHVWVDENYAGTLNSLSVPHVYDLSDWLTPGEHRLTLCVDNTVKINIGHTYGKMLWTHAITEETQTNWNGVIGRIELIATDRVWISSIQTFPNMEEQTTLVRVTVENSTRSTIEGTLSARAAPGGGSVNDVAFSTGDSQVVIETEVPFGPAPRLWDEFAPELYDLQASIVARAADVEYTDERSVRFGLREFCADGPHFRWNGRKAYLRGNVDSAVFPLTGYPPMSEDEWRRQLGVLKSYGINHVRFHSWCPPEAAFAVADELGIVFQAEPPLWDGYGLVGSDRDRAVFILREADSIAEMYGNHPSFCLMSMGNELGQGDDPYLRYLLDYLRKKDTRRLYTSTTHPPNLKRDDDYFVGARTEKGVTRGERPFGDFRAARTDYDRPLLTHELGQPAMYPNFEEIPKYTGPLKPRNLEAFRESLKEHGMLHLAEDFRRASGALLVEIYKENIEAQLRTPNAAGFQLLDLQDFSGHGTALIGVLDAFYDSKGLITPEQFRRFCGPTVPLIRMRGFIWTSDETFTATAEIAHYGPDDLLQQSVDWTISNDAGETLASGCLGPLDMPTGALTPLGEIKMKLDEAAVPCRLTLRVTLPGTEFANGWKFWVYPSEGDSPRTKDTLIVDAWDDNVRQVLADGGNVLLIPQRKVLENALPARWHPVFWSWQLFRKQPQVMGILCDPDHPALAEFPTESFGDWQWHDLLQRSEALPLNDAPAEFYPIVQFIPDFNLNRKLGAVFEARVGDGRLMVSMIDLSSKIETRPAARQLLSSLLAYMKSDRFQPAHSLSPEMLNRLFQRTAILENQGAPDDLDRAVLNIRAATDAARGKPEPWRLDVDERIVTTEGFGYDVRGQTWRDHRSSAWHATHLVVTVTCPPKFDGALYAHFHDWSEENRAAALFFNGRDLGPLHRYGGDGFWLKLPVTSEVSAEGRLTLDASVTKGPNVMISQIVLIPKGE